MRSPFPDVEIPDVPLSDFVLAGAGGLGDKPALIDGTSGRTITYAQFAESVRAVAAGLAEWGFGKGDVFAHYAPNVPEYAVAFHAVASVGGVNTTANPLLTADELAAQLRHCGARLLVTVPDQLEKATAAAERAGVEEIVVYGEAAGAMPFASLLQAAGRPPTVAIDPAEDLAALPYSSGTTGLPKGVMLTHRNLVANICQTLAHQRLRADDRVIAVLPFFHIYGLVVLMNMPLYRGATIVTMPRFDLAEFLRVVQQYRITRAWVVPPIVLALAKQPIVDEYELSSLKFMLSGAAPLSAELEVACGEPGELCIRGPQVMKGYLDNPEATAATIDPDGWLHTGDVARAAEHGSVWIVDRVKELIKYKGYQVAPAELEGLLLTHPAIADAAVIGVPDEAAGEVPKAFVVASGALTPEEVSAFVAERVAPYKKVRAVEIVDQIPKTPSGKVLRRVLIDRERAATPT
jgi:acyl-CoA synthetase (AMP-forming)/AMP-acid ligase II